MFRIQSTRALKMATGVNGLEGEMTHSFSAGFEGPASLCAFFKLACRRRNEVGGDDLL